MYHADSQLLAMQSCHSSSIITLPYAHSLAILYRFVEMVNVSSVFTTSKVNSMMVFGHPEIVQWFIL